MRPGIFKSFVSLSLVLLFNILLVQNSIGDDQIDKQIAQNESELKMLREERNVYANLLDPGVWLFKIPLTPEPIPMAVPKGQIIKLITVVYYRELINKGGRFNKNELARRIKYVRDMSNATKLELNREISSLNARIIKLENADYELANSRRMNNSRSPSSRASRVGGAELVCVDDDWNKKWKVDANVGEFLDQTQGGKKFLKNPGWKEVPTRVGDANPPKDNRTGIRYMHPLSREKPAILSRNNVDLTGISRLRIMTSGNCNTNGDYRLEVKVGGTSLGSKTVDCGWREVAFDLSAFNGKHNIEIDVYANGWSWEYAFFDCIELE